MTAQPAVRSTPQALFETHLPTLQGALEAIAQRGYWSPFPEHLKAYGEDAPAAGRAAFDAQLGAPFALDQPTSGRQVGSERSPYGFDLGVTYPHADADQLLEAAAAALPSWRDAGVQGRVGVVLELLQRINARSFELAHAVMHTTGQAFPMAFQAGGPHAQDRALEAVAYAYEAMSAVPETALWEKPQGKRPPLRMQKRFTVVGRGVGLVFGCNTFPTWNGYPGLFASLVTGNPVIVKPSRRAILPLAITVAIAREVLAEAGLDPNVVTLAVDADGERLAGPLSKREEVRIIDFTGSTAFGDQLEAESSTPSSSPRRPASTASSSTRPTTTRACSATSPSRSRSTAGRCARRRRTSTSRATGSRPTPATGRSSSSARTWRRRSRGC